MKLSFCKFVGLANGGTEKYLQSLAIFYKNNGHEVDYYYTNVAPSTWDHPDNDPTRENLLRDSGVNLKKIYLERLVGNEWINTNFFDIFKESDYDYLIGAGNGMPDYPYHKLKNIPIIHTIHGDHVFNQHNIKKSVLLCKWQADRWINNGGDSKKIEIIPSYVPVPNKWSNSFREKNNIPEDAFVYGFHQRNDNNISSNISLACFSAIKIPNTYFTILGGSDKHRNFVKENNIKNVIFIDYTSSIDTIHEFLDGIDVYAHCRNDGEVCSAAIIEAMYHGKPVISAPGLNMGHVEQIENCGMMCYSTEEYLEQMIRIHNKNYYDELTEKTKIKYYNNYDYKIVEKKFKELI